MTTPRTGRSVRDRGFTLIELLVVISIIAAILALAVRRFFAEAVRFVFAFGLA
jgi:prepilin-type N-terminal cleavage/methylation domain-containing protein